VPSYLEMNNVAGRGKGRKHFTFPFKNNYLFIVDVIIYILCFIHPPPTKLSFGINIHRSSEIVANYFPVIP